ncbi:MAG: hypothetical protein JEZ11_03865 [Desulfobacterales bacterium]|nr:hypothetical protein [Desulfobacterales bacterium]
MSNAIREQINDLVDAIFQELLTERKKMRLEIRDKISKLGEDLSSQVRKNKQDADNGFEELNGRINGLDVREDEHGGWVNEQLEELRSADCSTELSELSWKFEELEKKTKDDLQYLSGKVDGIMGRIAEIEKCLAHP